MGPLESHSHAIILASVLSISSSSMGRQESMVHLPFYIICKTIMCITFPPFLAHTVYNAIASMPSALMSLPLSALPSLSLPLPSMLLPSSMTFAVVEIGNMMLRLTWACYFGFFVVVVFVVLVVAAAVVVVVVKPMQPCLISYG